MMPNDGNKSKTNPAPKKEAPPESTSASGVDPSKAEGGELAAASPSSYSRGAGTETSCAASVAGLLITTEAMVAEVPRKQVAAPAMHGGGLDF
jgi:chaperonin GroEL